VLINIEMCSDNKRLNATPTMVTSPFLVNSLLNQEGLFEMIVVRRTKHGPGSAKLRTKVYQYDFLQYPKLGSMVTDRIGVLNTRSFGHHVKCDLILLTRMVTSAVSADSSTPHCKRPKRIGCSYRRLKARAFLIESK
jgi:hypothetical protein